VGDALYPVQSLNPAGALPVAGTTENVPGVGSGFVQWMHVRSSVAVPVTQQTSPWAVAVPGAVSVTQGTVPWVVQGSVTGTVVASVPGGLTVVAASVQGQVPVTQAGSPWGVSGTVGVTQTTSPWATRPGSTGDPQGSVVGSVGASQLGTWTVQQGGAPWTVTASVTGTAVVSVAGIAAVVGSVHAVVAGSVHATVVGSVAATVQGNVGVTQAGSLFVGVTGPTGLPATVSSYGGDGNLLRVDVVRGSAGGGGDGSLLDGADTSIKATVRSYANANPLAVVQVDANGDPLGGSSIVGSVVATQGGAWTVGQAGAPWTVVASVIGTVAASVSGTVVSSVVGTVAVQGSLSGTVVASVVGAVTVIGSLAGVVVASVIGTPTIVGSVAASIQGNVPVTQVTSPWVTRAGSSGDPQGSVVGSVAASQAGAWTVTANQGGAPWSVVGSVGASQLGTWTVVASVVGIPTVSVVSLSAPLTVVASVIGQPTVTASLVGIPTVAVVSLAATLTAVGSVWVSQVSSPWVTREVRGQAYEEHELTVPGSRGNMSFTNSVIGTHAASCTCATSAFSVVPTARTVTIRNLGPLSAKFRFRTGSAHLVTVDAGESLNFTFLEVPEFYVTTTSLTALRVLLA
jgi:hypothetical protein